MEEAVAGTLKKLDLQLALPHRPTDQDRGSSWKLKVPAEVIWLAAIVFAGILLYVLLDMIPGKRSHADEDWETRGGFLEAHPTPCATLAEADELAHQGLFANVAL
jgi:hypothetical protein